MRKWQDDIKGLRDFHLDNHVELGGDGGGGRDSVSLDSAERDVQVEQHEALPEYVPELELRSWHCVGRPRAAAAAQRSANGRARAPATALGAGAPRVEPVQHRLGRLERRALEFAFPVLRQRYGLLQCQGQPLPSVDFDQAAELWLEGAHGWFLANNYRVETQDAEKRFYPQLTGRGCIGPRASYVLELANQLQLQADLEGGVGVGAQSTRRRAETLRQQAQQEVDRLELSVTISALVE